MFKKLMPKERRFFALFAKAAAEIQGGLELFATMLRKYDDRARLSAEIKKAEVRADDIAHEIIDLLDNTFVTPFDREDIRLLVHNLDDVIDLVEATAARMEIYNLPPPPDDVWEMCSVLHFAFGSVSEAIAKMNDPKQRAEVQRICIEVNRLENDGDVVLRRALRGLFQNANDPIHIIKMKEIYENLEEAIDRCEDLANIIETILIKNS